MIDASTKNRRFLIFIIISLIVAAAATYAVIRFTASETPPSESVTTAETSLADLTMRDDMYVRYAVPIGWSESDINTVQSSLPDEYSENLTVVYHATSPDQSIVISVNRREMTAGQTLSDVVKNEHALLSSFATTYEWDMIEQGLERAEHQAVYTTSEGQSYASVFGSQIMAVGDTGYHYYVRVTGSETQRIIIRAITEKLFSQLNPQST